MNHIIWSQNEVNIDEIFTYSDECYEWKWGSITNDHWRLSTKKWLPKMKIYKEA